MSLPSTYYNIYKYFDDALTFLKEYEWIYNYPNTDVLVEGFLQKIPEDWRDYFRNIGFSNLRDIALHQVKGDCPQSFKIFLYKLQHLTSTSGSYEIKQSENILSHNCGLSMKKKHEIEMLAPVVAELCEKTNSKHVIDIGAGLGHLSFMLANKYNYSVLAIEGCIEKIELAVKTESKFYKNSIISFHHHFITEKSFDEISEAIEKKLGSSNKICMYGLHACADLSAVILDLFLKLTNVKSLVIMPCCYHRLDLDKVIDEEVYFKNFPLSDVLKSMFEKHKATSFLRRPFLRLACQQTVKKFIDMSENEHIYHAENFMWRAVLQQAAKEFDCNVLRLKRKMGQPKNKENVFEYHLENLPKTHTLLSKDITVNPPEIGGFLFKNKILTIWKKEEHNLILFAAFTTLQNSLQNLCENILLQDRVQFMNEKGVNCYIKQITDDSISPRCMALIAIKD
ncbi:hypothetical protein WA026_002298 [Henosepilachna vigintioctopunctata]|uniref:Methyltransferase domain-containing protein n=1 Tax=Henosepilachna vigintioctopunctata TaxID=420089 RepID=A0AAW1TZC3_9CUCU